MRKNIFTNYFAFVLIAAIILQSFSFGAPLMNNANADEIKENSNIQVEEQNIIPEGKQYIPEQTEQSQAASALGILESQGVPTYSINEQPDRGEATGSQQLLQDGANTSHELLNREPDDSQQLLSKKDEPDESDESVYKKDEPDGSDELLYKLNEPDGSEESLNKQGETNHSEESLHKQTEPNALNQLFNTPTDGGEEITGKQAVTSQLIEISFSQNEYNLVADETFQTVVTAVYSDDSSFEITDKCEFNIDNETIAEIDSNGVILAKNIGQAQLFAVYNGLYCSATLNVNHKDLSVPINLTTENLTEQITVMWESVSEADGYDLLVDEVIQTVSDNVYCHDNLIPDTLHTYKVRAKQEERVSAWSHEVSAWTNKAEVSIVKIEFVSEEYKLMAGESCQSVVNVVYSDDSFFDITSECIFNIEDETIAEINSEGIIQAKDVGQTQVFAVYKDYSCTAAIKIGLQKPQNIRTENKADQITIMWDPVECTGYYELEADEINITVTDTVYLHSNLYPNTQHIYKIRAIKGEHVSDWSNEILALTNLSTPVNLYAEKDEENCTVKLNWDDVQDATGYKVYRNGEEVDNVLTNEFIGSGLEVGVLYEYTVKAYSANNESAQSEPIDVS